MSRNPSHQRPPPPYPSGGARMTGPRAGAGQGYSGRGRGNYNVKGYTAQSAPPHVLPVSTSLTTASSTSSVASTPTSNASPSLVTVPSSSSGTASAPPAVLTSTATVNQQTSEAKILSNPNPVCLCKIGQGTVQDIVSMTMELFNYMKTITPPNTTTLQTPSNVPGVLPIAAAQEKAHKVEEHLKEVLLLFKKLKVVYKNLLPMPNDDQTLIDIDKTQDLIPMKKRKLESDQKDGDSDEALRKRKFESPAYIKAARELTEVKEKLRSKNQELKSIIDDSRTTIWEINAMLGMRNLGSTH